jgi:hypothetical protein
MRMKASPWQAYKSLAIDQKALLNSTCTTLLSGDLQGPN